jgi:hypothetical protein
MALHALLIAAAALVGAGLWIKVLAGAAAVAHCLRRWPGGTPAEILVSEECAVLVPALDQGWLVPCARTRAGPWWLRLSLVGGSGAHDILLCIDQLDRPSWSRLNARLRRRPKEGTPGAPGTQTTGRVDLR